MNHCKFLLCTGGLLLSLAACGGSSKGKTPLPELVSVIQYRQHVSTHTLTAQDSYPKLLETLRIEHTGSGADIEFGFSEQKGAVRATPGRGVIEPGKSATITVEALGLSYTETDLKMQCIYVDPESTDELEVVFGYSINGGKFPGPKLATVIEVTEPTKLRHMLRPGDPFPIQLDEMSVRYTATAGIPVRVSLADGQRKLGAVLSRQRLLPGEAAGAKIEAVASQFGLAVLHLSVEYDIVAHDDEFGGQWIFRNASPPSMSTLFNLNTLTNSNPSVETRFWPGLSLDPIGVSVRHPMGGARDQVPALDFTEIGVAGSLVVDLSADQLLGAFWKSQSVRGGTTEEALFPPGVGRNGLTIHPRLEVDMPAGGYQVFHLALEGSIPHEDPEEANEHLYTFALDADLDPANDWIAPPAMPFDPHQGTDRWYEVGYTKAGGWTLVVSQVSGTQTVAEVPSGARVVLSDNGLMLMVPASEFGPVKPAWRGFSFVHQGDQGVPPPYLWSGDVMPAVGEPLLLSQ